MVANIHTLFPRCNILTIKLQAGTNFVGYNRIVYQMMQGMNNNNNNNNNKHVSCQLSDNPVFFIAKGVSWFQTFAMFCMLYAFFWVIPRHLNFICRRFRTLCLFHLHRQVGAEGLGLRNFGVSIWEKVWLENDSSYFQAKPFPMWIPQHFSNLVNLHLPAHEDGTDRVF